MHKKQLIRTKPAYFRGQLLLEDDFIAEQRYHAQARYRHNLNVHGWGIGRGLRVAAAGDSAVVVSPGFAIDAKGHEIELHEAAQLDLSSLPAATSVHITLGYDEDAPQEGEREKPRVRCYAVLGASTGTPENAVLLAVVHLDAQGRLKPESISVGAVRRMDSRRWLTMPFRPIEMPPDEEKSKPPFRVGPTQAVAHKFYPDEKTANTRGAAGSMAFPLSSDVTQIHRFRIAGEVNEKQIDVTLWLGGWDGNKHFTQKLLKRTISVQPYYETIDVEIPISDAENRSLSVEVRSEGYAKVSLVGIEWSTGFSKT